MVRPPGKQSVFKNRRGVAGGSSEHRPAGFSDSATIPAARFPAKSHRRALRTAQSRLVSVPLRHRFKKTLEGCCCCPIVRTPTGDGYVAGCKVGVSFTVSWADSVKQAKKDFRQFPGHAGIATGALGQKGQQPHLVAHVGDEAAWIPAPRRSERPKRPLHDLRDVAFGGRSTDPDRTEDSGSGPSAHPPNPQSTFPIALFAGAPGGG